MNRLTIIGNLTGDPEMRTTPNKKTVCNFSVAVNRRQRVDGQPEADFFRVSAWNQLGELCGKYLAKGRKVCVVGAVSVRMYESQNGKQGASLEVNATEVEFLSGRSDQDGGMTRVEPADNPFVKPEGAAEQEKLADELPF